MSEDKKIAKKTRGIFDKALPKSEFDLFLKKDIFRMFIEKLPEDDVKNMVSEHLQKIADKHKIDNYNVVFFYAESTSLTSYQSDVIYQSLTTFSEPKDILLLLSNNGGEIEPAFLISKTCKHHSKNKFVVTIPRRAKSAATLLALGADEIHMGSMSELGPIDPQIGGLPALGLGNSLEYIAKVVCKFPESSNMFSQYLTSKLDLSILGYFERVSESAVQYAERLIGSKVLPNKVTAKQVAYELVHHYKDHSFVIDVVESKALLGDNIIKENTEEYDYSNEVYGFFRTLANLFLMIKRQGFTYVGSAANGMNLHKIEE